MPPQWNSSGLLGGPERRHGDRRTTARDTADRRRRSNRRHMRTAVLAAAMSSAPMVRPVVALLPPSTKLKPGVDVSAVFFAVITTATSTWRWRATTPAPATSSAPAACRRFVKPGTTSRPSSRSSPPGSGRPTPTDESFQGLAILTAY